MSDQPGQGRARGRGGRGRKPQQQQPAPPGAAAAPPVQQPPPQREVGGSAHAPPVGRGRARGAAQRQELSQQPPAPQIQQPRVEAAPDLPTGGRGMHRGGGREGAAPPVGQMSRMNIRGDGDRVRRMPYDRYVENCWKPEGKPKHGTSGRPGQLLGNYFQVELPSTSKIYQYHVSFKPEIENMRIRYALIASLSDITGPVRCFDGGILYIVRLLNSDPMVCHTTRTYDDAKIEITFKLTCEVHTSSPQFLQITNIMLKKIQSALNMKLIRDHYFNTALTIQIPRHKLEVMPGFETSIHKYDGGILLAVNIVHKILRMDTFLDCMYNLYESVAPDRFQDTCLKNYVGTIVMTKHNNKTYRVDDIAWDMRPTDSFDKNGTKVTYVDYYKEHWNLDIHDLNQPLLVTRPTERDVRRGQSQNLYLLPELCTITGLSEEARSDFSVMKDLAVHTRIGPEQRLKTLETFLNQINTNEKVKTILDPWKMSISKKPLTVPCRNLPSEKLDAKGPRGGPFSIEYDIKEADWSRAMRNIHLLNAVHMDNWIIIFPSRALQQATELSDCLAKVGKGMGMRISSPVVVEMSTDRNDAYLQAIRQNLQQSTQIIVTIVPNNRKDRYDAIKKSCCIDNPVLSQVVVSRTLMKKQGLMSVATKIAIQMNCKMGGEVWGSTIPVDGLMIIGLDAYHDSLHKGKSVGAMVATLNKQCTRYFCKTEMHDSKVETMQNFSVLLLGALRKYHEVNQSLPKKIVVYRDGVGDGQLRSVFTSEKEQIDAAIKQNYDVNYKPAIAFIVVKKRINARLFMATGPGGQSLTNPPPGTIVDNVITKTEWYDFFLVSQSVRQGTVTPTNYNVIFDETGLKPDHIQKLTYKLTHLYFNWQGTIRVPAPCQYAHKLAFLQGQSLHREPSAHLCDKLFFL